MNGGNRRRINLKKTGLTLIYIGDFHPFTMNFKHLVKNQKREISSYRFSPWGFPRKQFPCQELNFVVCIATSFTGGDVRFLGTRLYRQTFYQSINLSLRKLKKKNEKLFISFFGLRYRKCFRDQISISNFIFNLGKNSKWKYLFINLI